MRPNQTQVWYTARRDSSPFVVLFEKRRQQPYYIKHIKSSLPFLYSYMMAWIQQRSIAAAVAALVQLEVHFERGREDDEEEAFFLILF